jgi:aspartyl/asparaginyl beta-hydroxylase (cupin superfamily)
MINSYAHSGILKPDVVDANGFGWKVSTVTKFAANELTLETGTQLTRRAKDMSTDYETATKIADDASKMFKKSYSDLIETTAQLQTSTKKVSGDIRKSADDLAQGLLKVQKQADFHNLTRYVELLERAATAMTTLADLEKAGKLQKIAGALK